MKSDTMADLVFMYGELSSARECVSVCVRRTEGGPHHELVCAVERELTDILRRIDAVSESLWEGQR